MLNTSDFSLNSPSNALTRVRRKPSQSPSLQQLFEANEPKQNAAPTISGLPQEELNVESPKIESEISRPEEIEKPAPLSTEAVPKSPIGFEARSALAPTERAGFAAGDLSRGELSTQDLYKQFFGGKTAGTSKAATAGSATNPKPSLGEEAQQFGMNVGPKVAAGAAKGGLNDLFTSGDVAGMSAGAYAPVGAGFGSAFENPAGGGQEYFDPGVSETPGAEGGVSPSGAAAGGVGALLSGGLGYLGGKAGMPSFITSGPASAAGGAAAGAINAAASGGSAAAGAGAGALSGLSGAAPTALMTLLTGNPQAGAMMGTPLGMSLLSSSMPALGVAGIPLAAALNIAMSYLEPQHYGRTRALESDSLRAAAQYAIPTMLNAQSPEDIDTALQMTKDMTGYVPGQTYGHLTDEQTRGVADAISQVADSMRMAFQLKAAGDPRGQQLLDQAAQLFQTAGTPYHSQQAMYTNPEAGGPVMQGTNIPGSAILRSANEAFGTNAGSLAELYRNPIAKEWPSLLNQAYINPTNLYEDPQQQAMYLLSQLAGSSA